MSTEHIKTSTLKSQWHSFWLICLPLLALPVTGAESPLTVYAESSNYDNTSFTQDPASTFVAAVLSEAGYGIDINLVPWTRLLQSLESQHDVLAFYMTRTPDREDHYHWIGKLRPADFKLWGLRSRSDELPRTLEDAREARISAIRDDVVTNYLVAKGFSNLVYLSDNADKISLLERDRIDLIPYIESGIADYLRYRGEPETILVPVISLDEISSGHYLVMSKTSDLELVKRLQDAFQSLVQRGDLDSIMGSQSTP